MRANLVPIHWRANNQKRDRIVNTLPPTTLRQGLTVDHFKHLSRTYHELSSKVRLRQEVTHMKALLLKGAMRGPTPPPGPNLWEELKALYDPKELLGLWKKEQFGVYSV